MKKIIFILFLMIITFNSVKAIMISPDFVRIEFVPNFEDTYLFHTTPGKDAEILLEGELATYVTVKENNIKKDGTFLIHVALPEKIEPPGKHLVFVQLLEKSSGGGMISGRAAIRTPIDIRVPYPGSYAEFGFSAPDLNIDEKKEMVATVKNLGIDVIEKASAYIEIFDINKEKIDHLKTTEKKVLTSQTVSLPALFDASKHSAGEYTAVAHISSGKHQEVISDKFRIGDLNVNLVNYTKEFNKDSISPFELIFESGWNNDIYGISAEVKILNETKEISSFKTITFDLKPWERKSIETFWDSTGFGIGSYDIEIYVKYNNKNDVHKGLIEIADAKSPFTEFLSNLSSGSLFNSTNLLIVVLIGIIIFLFFRNKRNLNTQKNSKYNKPRATRSNIKKKQTKKK